MDLGRGGPVAGRALHELQSMIRDPSVKPPEIAALLDGLADGARVATVRGLGRAAQRALFARVEGFAPVRLVDLVAARIPDEQEVRHLGRNTLPVFRNFEKRFCRPAGEPPDAPTKLAGYNFQALSALTGPGYYLAFDDGGRGEVLIDYRRLPDHRPPGWPEIRSNERGLARLVYGFMVDRLRRVSEHVTIGRATRAGRDLDSWFVLCRQGGVAD